MSSVQKPSGKSRKRMSTGTLLDAKVGRIIHYGRLEDNIGKSMRLWKDLLWNELQMMSQALEMLLMIMYGR